MVCGYNNVDTIEFWTCTECGYTNAISENNILDDDELSEDDTGIPTYGELIKSVLDLAHEGLKVYAESKGIDLVSLNETDDDQDEEESETDDEEYYSDEEDDESYDSDSSYDDEEIEYTEDSDNSYSAYNDQSPRFII